MSSALAHVLPEGGRNPWKLMVAGSLLAAGVAVANPSVALGLAILGTLACLSMFSVRSALLTMIVLAPWTSLANALVDDRFVAAGPDIFVVALFASLLFVLPTRDIERGSRNVLLGVALCLLLGIAEMFNPHGLPKMGALEGYRAFFIPMMGVPIGAILQSSDRRFSSMLQLAIIASALLVAVMGIRQAISPSAIDWAIIHHAQSDFLTFEITGTTRLRAFSPLAGPFHFGLLVSLALLTTAARSFSRPRAWHLPAFAILAVALVLNATRLNWLGTAVGLVVLLLASVQRKTLRQWFSRLALLVLIAAPIPALLTHFSSLSPLQRFAAEFLKDPTANTSFVYRVLGWEHDVLPAIARAPLLGYGTGTAKDGIGIFTSHNVLLKVALEGGFVLTGLYLLMLLLAAIALVRTRHQTPSRLALAAIFAVHAAGMFGPLLDAYPANIFFWLLLGSALPICLTVPDAGIEPEFAHQ